MAIGCQSGSGSRSQVTGIISPLVTCTPSGLFLRRRSSERFGNGPDNAGHLLDDVYCDRGSACLQGAVLYSARWLLTEPSPTMSRDVPPSRYSRWLRGAKSHWASQLNASALRSPFTSCVPSPLR